MKRIFPPPKQIVFLALGLGLAALTGSLLAPQQPPAEKLPRPLAKELVQEGVDFTTLPAPAKKQDRLRPAMPATAETVARAESSK